MFKIKDKNKVKTFPFFLQGKLKVVYPYPENKAIKKGREFPRPLNQRMILLFLIIQSGTLEQPNVAANEAAYRGIVARAHTNVVLVAEDDNIALLRSGISVLSITVIIRFTKNGAEVGSHVAGANNDMLPAAQGFCIAAIFFVRFDVVGSESSCKIIPVFAQGDAQAQGATVIILPLCHRDVIRDFLEMGSVKPSPDISVNAIGKHCKVIYNIVA